MWSVDGSQTRESSLRWRSSDIPPGAGQNRRCTGDIWPIKGKRRKVKRVKTRNDLWRQTKEDESLQTERVGYNHSALTNKSPGVGRTRDLGGRRRRRMSSSGVISGETTRGGLSPFVSWSRTVHFPIFTKELLARKEMKLLWPTERYFTISKDAQMQ